MEVKNATEINKFIKKSVQQLSEYDKKIERTANELNDLKNKRDKYYKKILADMLKKCNVPIEGFFELLTASAIQDMPAEQNKNNTQPINQQSDTNHSA